MHSRVGVALIAFAVIVVSVAAFPRLLTWRLQTALSRVVSAEAVSVRLQASPLAGPRGRFARLELLVRNARLQGLPVRELRADFADIEIDGWRAFYAGTLVIRRIGGGRAALIVSEDDLQHYLAATKGVRGARVRLAGGVLDVGGRIMVQNVPIDLAMSARLVVSDGRRVTLRVETMTVSGLTLPPDVADVLMSSLNPLLTTEQVPIPLQFRDVKVDDGMLVLTAEPSS